MSANYQLRAEAEASLMLAKLAGDMEHAAVRLPALLAHKEHADHNAEQLRGAAACVRKWSEKLKP